MKNGVSGGQKVRPTAPHAPHLRPIAPHCAPPTFFIIYTDNEYNIHFKVGGGAWGALFREFLRIEKKTQKMAVLPVFGVCGWFCGISAFFGLLVGYFVGV